MPETNLTKLLFRRPEFLNIRPCLVESRSVCHDGAPGFWVFRPTHFQTEKCSTVLTDPREFIDEDAAQGKARNGAQDSYVGVCGHNESRSSRGDHQLLCVLRPLMASLALGDFAISSLVDYHSRGARTPRLAMGLLITDLVGSMQNRDSLRDCEAYTLSTDGSSSTKSSHHTSWLAWGKPVLRPV